MARLGNRLVTATMNNLIDRFAQATNPLHDRPPRACGGLTLIKVLSRFGVDRSIHEVWPHISRPGLRGQRCARSFLIGKYAADSGLSAAVIQCHRATGWAGLMTCASNGLKVIINHRATNDGTSDAVREGHFTILNAISHESIEIDDPTAGNFRRLSKQSFMDLWQPNHETAGFVMIAMSAEACVDGSQNIASCPRCGVDIRFQPRVLFDPLHWHQGGCFKRFFCLGCDAAFR